MREREKGGEKEEGRSEKGRRGCDCERGRSKSGKGGNYRNDFANKEPHLRQ